MKKKERNCQTILFEELTGDDDNNTWNRIAQSNAILSCPFCGFYPPLQIEEER